MQSYDTSRQTTSEPTTSTVLGLPHEPVQRALQRVMAQRAQSDELRAATAQPEAVQHAAESGIQGAGGALPHLDRIQASFGRHDVGDVRAHVGGNAREAASSMGAEAYATGSDVAFGEAPSLHLAAHEAAHVVQQRGGVQLKGGVGEAGDVYERHADAVADRVVAGQSAEALLDVHIGGSASTGVQMKGEEPETPSSNKADDKTATDKAKMKLTVQWRGKFGGDLSAKVAVTPVGKGETGSATVTDPDADKGGSSSAHAFQREAPVMSAEHDPDADRSNCQSALRARLDHTGWHHRAGHISVPAASTPLRATCRQNAPRVGFSLVSQTSGVINSDPLRLKERLPIRRGHAGFTG